MLSIFSPTHHLPPKRNDFECKRAFFIVNDFMSKNSHTNKSFIFRAHFTAYGQWIKFRWSPWIVRFECMKYTSFFGHLKIPRNVQKAEVLQWLFHRKNRSTLQASFYWVLSFSDTYLWDDPCQQSLSISLLIPIQVLCELHLPETR